MIVSPRLRRSPVTLSRQLLSITLGTLLVLQHFLIFSPSTAEAAGSASIVISQVYGGGGNSSATYRNDYVELFNRSTTTVSLSGWSVQYASATGTGTFASNPISTLSGSLAPGQYYLVQLASGGTTGALLPAADASQTSLNIAAGGGKIVLANTTTGLACNGSSGQPCSASDLAKIIDLVGYGSANFSEGSPAPGPSNNTTSIFRASGGCTDSDNNASDFSLATPNPRNKSSALNVCNSATAPAITTQPQSQTITSGETATLSVVANGTAPLSYQWYQGTASNTGTPVGANSASFTTPALTSTTSYWVRVSNSAGAADSNTATIAVNPAPTSPTGTGSASPNSVPPGGSTTLTVSVTPGANPTSTGLSVTADLSSIGGSSSQSFTSSGNTFTFQATVAANASPGAKTLPVAISDAQGRSGSTTIGLTVEQLPTGGDNIVISQVYGGGGNSSATYQNDFIELYNRGTSTVILNGWSVQYASSTGGIWQITLLGGVINPGEYYLVQQAAGTGCSGAPCGSPLPVTPNVTGTINMGATAGKVALVNNSTLLDDACPSDPAIVDLVGYGTGTNCYEGTTGPTAAPSSTRSVFRNGAGSTDTDDNKADFTTGSVNPRRTASTEQFELAPVITSTYPRANGVNAPRDASLNVNFSEPVFVRGAWYTINCAVSGPHTATLGGGPAQFVFTPNTPFTEGEQCTVNITAALVNDQDDLDPPDNMAADYNWTFMVATGPPAPYPPSVHLTMGNPSNATADIAHPENYLMEKDAFTISYNRDRGTPNWVSWHLNTAWLGSLTRIDTFRPDPAVPADWYRVQASDYTGSGFDRGHMTPNADRTSSIPVNQTTFLMTNLVPQSPDNNQGPWAALESELRVIARAGNELYVISGGAGTGGTGSNGQRETVANGRVAVPAVTWKVIMVLPDSDGDDVARVNNETRAYAVIMPNVQGIRNDDWRKYLATVRQVEALTGYNFFSNVSSSIQDVIETRLDPSLNTAPQTSGAAVTTAEDNAVTFTLTGTDSNINNALSFNAVDAPAHGTLNFGTVSCPPNNNQARCTVEVTYTPSQDYNGSDSFTFKVNDGGLDSNVATVSITVTEVNDAPVAGNDSKSTKEGASLVFPASDLLVNDRPGPDNESSQTLTLTGVISTPNTGGTVTLSNGQITFTPAANYNGTASFDYQVCDNGTTNGAADARCALATVNITVIAKANQTIWFGALANKTYGDADFTVDATATSGLAVSFAASGNCTASGSTVHITSAGSCTIIASQDGNSDYYAAPDALQTFTINRATTTTAVTVGNATYDGYPHGGTATVTGAGGLNQSLTVTYAGRNGTIYGPTTTAPTDAGDYTASASFDGDANRSGSNDSKNFQIAKATATLSLGNLNQTYNGSPRAASATTDPAGLAGVSITYEGSTTAPTGAGSYAVVASLNNANYRADNATGALTINKAAPVVTATGNTCTYSGSPCTGIGSATGVDGADLGAVTLTYTPGSSAPINAGSYSVVASIAETANHTAGSSAAVSVTINKATPTISVIVPSSAVTYDGNAHPATGFAYGVGGAGDALTPAVSFTYNGSSNAPVNAATYAVAASFAGNDNYLPAVNNSTSIIISQAAAAINVSGYTGVYDGQAHRATGSATGVQGENLTSLLDLGSSFTDAPGGAANWSFAGNTNYAPANGSVAITINKATPTITWGDPASIVFGTPLSATQLNATASVPGTFSYTPAAGTVLSAGQNQVLTGNFVPADAINYNAGMKSVRLTVNPAPTQSSVAVTPHLQQYSDRVTFVARLTPPSLSGQAPAQNVTFLVSGAGGTVNLGTVSLVAEQSTGSLVGTLSDTQLLLSPGAYAVTAQFGGINPSFVVINPTTNLTITPEDAGVSYTGTLFAQTASISSSTAGVTLSANVQDTTVVTGALGSDPYPGDVRNATVTFIDRATNTAISPPIAVNSADGRTGTVSYNWTATLPAGATAQTFRIGLVVGGYYARTSTSDDVIVNVSQPVSSGFLTGGGYLVMTANSSGAYRGDAGSRMSFGFNSTVPKKLTATPEGNITLIVHSNGGRVYLIKSGNLTAAKKVGTNTAAFGTSGGATLQDITDWSNPGPVTPNLSLLLTMTDYAGGSNDTLGVQLTDSSNTILFSSNWNGTKTVEQLLRGGELVVR